MSEGFHPGEVWAELKLAPEDERTKKEKEFHKRRLQQKEGIALMVGEVMDVVEKNPDVESTELIEIIEGLAPDVEMAAYQREIGKDLIKVFDKRRRELKKWEKKGLSEKQLLLNMVNPRVAPKGKEKVEVNWGRFSVHFRVPALTYASIYGSDHAFLSGGFYSEARFPLATFEKQDFYPPVDDSVQAHEEAHALFAIVRDVLDKHLGRSLFERPSPVHSVYERRIQHEGFSVPARQFIQASLRAHADRVKNEVFAFTREYTEKRVPRSSGLNYPTTVRGPQGIVSTLLQDAGKGGLYDYYRSDKRWLREMALRTQAPGNIELANEYYSIFSSEHRSMVKEAVDAIHDLIRKEGYSFMQAFVFLIDVPVERWRKELQMLKDLKEKT